MSDFSDEMAAIALDLLTEFGEAVSFTQTTPGAYDAATAATAAGSDVVFTGVGVPLDYDRSDIDDRLVLQADIKLFVDAVSTVPEVGDQATLDSIVYRIMNVRKHTINSETVLYELQLRI